ncbi:MAG: cobalamin biosynthesis protein CobW [Rhizobiaceae bacterium]|jgi:cobalamin biosynthesis protein CobW
MTSLQRIPCSVIAGFLDAGKTTLVRNLLQESKGKQFSIIVNEFCDDGIDREILRKYGVENCTDEDIVELVNDCICCTVSDDFVSSLDKIPVLKPCVDHILIETSGLALPRPLVQTFQWPGVKNRVTVDGVVTEIDGPALVAGEVTADREVLEQQCAVDSSIDQEYPVEEVFENQVACADLIVLSKSDLLSDVERRTVEARVAGYLSRAVKIVVLANGNIDPGVPLGLGLAVDDDIDARKTHHDDEPDHEHDDLDSFDVDLPVVNDPVAFVWRIAAAAEAANVLLLKGFVRVEGKLMRLLVRAVGSRVTQHYNRAWTADEPSTPRLTVIGLKGIDRAKVEQLLAA